MHLFLLAFALLFTQQTDDLSIIEGQVVDKLTGAPIAGARVIAARIDKGLGIGPGVLDAKPTAGEQDPKANQAAVLTGPDGKFRFRFQGEVRCMLFADAEGYVRPQAGIYPDNMFTAKPGSPKSDVLFRLAHALYVSGRVLDADTEQPVPGLSVTSLTNRSTSSGHYLSMGGTAKTDSEGRFKIERVAPGDYYLQVAPPLNAGLSKVRPIEEFRNDSEKTYVKSFYPDAVRVEEALPVKLAEGAPIEGVEIRIKKRKTASIRGRVLGDVPPGAPPDVSIGLFGIEQQLTGMSFSIIAQGKLKAGDEFEIDHLNPCTCYLSATMRGDRPKVALLSLVIGEDNQDGLDLNLRPTVSLNGHVRMEGREPSQDQPALPTDSVRISFRPVMLESGLNSGQPVPVAARDGSFTAENFATNKYYVTGAPAGYAISEVRYNNTVCPSGMVPVEAAAEHQDVEVKLAQTGSIVATVTDGSNPLSGGIVLLAPEAAGPDVLYLGYELRQSTATENGRASFAGLIAGAYRLIAYTPGAQWADDPGFRDRMRNGTRIEVTANQQQQIELRAQSLR